MIRFTAQSVSLDAAAGDAPRTISGIAVPYGVDANVSTGQTVRIEAGALPVDGPSPRLLAEHDNSKVIGMVTAREDTADGMLFTAEIARTTAGNDIVELLKMGAYDSVSIGIEPTDVEQDGRTTVVKAANWSELSIVFEPAFAAAKITEIAASVPEEETPDTPNPEPSEEDTEMTESAPIEAAPEVVPTAPIYAAAKREARLPSATEWIAAAIEGGDTWHRMNEQVRAAAPDVVTTDTPGILPTPIVSPAYNNFSGRRPVIDAIGAKAMPGGGKVFIRPEVTTHTSMAVQSAENAALQAGTFVVSSNQVTKGTYGGYVTISEQDLDWTDPAVLSLVLDDMGRIYANTTDNVAADALLAGQTQTQVLTDPTSASEWVSDIYAAASTILTNSNGGYATHLFLAPNMWAALGTLVDSTGRPLFPQVGPMNAFGSVSPVAGSGNAFGLTVVVDRNFAADTVIIGDPSGFEIFEQQKGAISVDVPSTLSRTIAWRGYFATLMIDPTKFVSIT
jgi:HK97 family phage prohead protease